MKISARNVLSGKVASIARGESSAEVVVKIGRTKIVSVMDLESVDILELKKGTEVYAVFKASDVMVGVPHHKRGE